MIQKRARTSVEEAVRAVSFLTTPESQRFLDQFSELLEKTFKAQKKVLIAGNGGSLCDASHFAEELTGYFRKKRRAFPALVLSEPGHITCVGNDAGFEYIFQRGVEAFGLPQDMFIALSTSGNSLNLIHALEAAKKQSLTTVSFLGKEGGKMKGMADLELHVQGFSSSDRIQEAHMAALHIAIELFEIRMGVAS